LANGAGLTLDIDDDEQMDDAVRTAKRKERIREAKKIIKRSLEALKTNGFLESFEISSTGLVRVVRASRR